MLNKINKAIRNERVVAELAVLKAAELNRIAVDKKMAHRFRAVVNATIPVWMPEMDVEPGTKLTWDNSYLLTDECFNEMLERKHKVILANGFDMEFGCCPILRAEQEVRVSIQNLIDLHAELFNEDFQHITGSLNTYRQFKTLMIQVAFSHESWKK